MLEEVNGASAPTSEPPPMQTAEAAEDEREAARAGIRAAIDAGKIVFSSSFEAVRFQVAASVPAWVLKGAWEEARPSLAPPPAPERSAEEPWDGQGAEHDAAPGHDHLDDLDRVPGDTIPTIRVIAGHGQIGRMIRECIRALGEQDHNLFMRSGELVRIIREADRREPYENDADGAHPDKRRGRSILMRPGTPKIGEAAPVLLERCDLVARWERFDARRGEREDGKGSKPSGEWVAANPDPTVVKQIAVRKDWPGIRPIRGIIETPCLAPSGRLIQIPGYDEETNFVLVPSCDVGPIADRPTQEQARAALRYLWIECFCDFPFRTMGEPDHANDPNMRARFAIAAELPDAFVCIAMLLTILARPAIIGAVPGGLFEAAGQGSGKSKQIHVASVIATSRSAGVATFPTRDGRPNEEELEKVIMGYAMASARIVAFDNIRGLLAGSTIERALTSEETISGRVLGITGQPEVPWTAVLLFSGNNMVTSDDIAQRVLVARLESPREDPRTREATTFRHPNLLGWIRENRPRCVRAALVILRAYVAARDDGADVPVLSRGNFESWAGIVASSILWAGGPNILRAFPEAGRGGDEEGEAHATLMRLWSDGWQGQRASMILDGIFRGEKDAAQGGPDDGYADARSAVRALTRTRERDVPSAHALAMKLSGLRGKIRNGMRIDVVRDKATNVATYWVTSATRASA